MYLSCQASKQAFHYQGSLTQLSKKFFRFIEALTKGGGEALE